MSRGVDEGNVVEGGKECSNFASGRCPVGRGKKKCTRRVGLEPKVRSDGP